MIYAIDVLLREWARYVIAKDQNFLGYPKKSPIVTMIETGIPTGIVNYIDCEYSETSQIDDLINNPAIIENKQRLILSVFYLEIGLNQKQKAKRLGCRVRQMYYDLHDIHVILSRELDIAHTIS